MPFGEPRFWHPDALILLPLEMAGDAEVSSFHSTVVGMLRRDGRVLIDRPIVLIADPRWSASAVSIMLHGERVHGLSGGFSLNPVDP